jgi:flavin-dependent dehydrogenase
MSALEEFPVAVVGAGPVGLAAAAVRLSKREISSP